MQGCRTEILQRHYTMNAASPSSSHLQLSRSQIIGFAQESAEGFPQKQHHAAHLRSSLVSSRGIQQKIYEILLKLNRPHQNVDKNHLIRYCLSYGFPMPYRQSNCIQSPHSKVIFFYFTECGNHFLLTFPQICAILSFLIKKANVFYIIMFFHL